MRDTPSLQLDQSNPGAVAHRSQLIDVEQARGLSKQMDQILGAGQPVGCVVARLLGIDSDHLISPPL